MYRTPSVVQKPATYHTVVDGRSVTAATNMDAIATTITSSQVSSVVNNNQVDLTSAASLNNLVNTIRSVADTVAPGGSSSSTVDLGSVSSLKTVVVNGDFTMNGGASGAGDGSW